MREYEKPVVVDNSELSEGVYALESGYDPGYQLYLRWEGQNSGSHSELRGGIVTGPNLKGNYISITCTYVGKPGITLTELKNFSGPYTPTVSGNTVVLTRNGSFNPNEDVQFAFQAVFAGGPISNGHYGSFYETETHRNESAIMDGTWTISATIS